MRYFFHIGYDGRDYRGWQKHPKAVSVQAVLEQQLQQIFKQPVPVIGCGRTDAEVHALQFFFHADIAQHFDFDLRFRLNKTLPHSIAIFDIFPMEGLPHCRFDAFYRSYDYFFHTYKDPFLHNYSSLYQEEQLDLQAMTAAVALLPLYNDYYGFCKSPTKYEHTICHVSAAALYQNKAGDRFRFHIASNRFLAGMIRIIMYKLLEVGRGETTVADFERCLSDRDHLPDVSLAYPQGLFLSKVTYPYLDLPTRTDFFGAFQMSDADYWGRL